jgi:2-oxo-4-hydroxy-4-carboxy-5-ureidoimidazoline decarboxylase
LPEEKLKEELTRCCGSAAWVNSMLPHFPVEDLVELLEESEEQWFDCSADDWKEAFSHHPKIGDTESLKKKFAATAEWAGNEQSGVTAASPQTLEELVKYNKEYEEKFGYIFIVCASGKTADEMLALLKERLSHKPDYEVLIAAEEQIEITKLRLKKLLE